MGSTNELPPEVVNSAYGIVVKRGKGEEIPLGSKPISLSEIVKIQYMRICTWVPQEDVWAIRHSVKLASLFTALTGVTSLMYVRRFFQLHTQRIPTTFVPAVIVPAGFAGVINELFIRNRILEGTVQCPLCMDLRGAVAQVIGEIYPIGLYRYPLTIRCSLARLCRCCCLTRYVSP